MLLMSYAAVPLYKLFCQVTGYGGTPMVVEENFSSKTFGKIYKSAVLYVYFDNY